MTKTKKYVLVSALCFALFALFTVVVATCDVQPVGVQGTFIGLATLNSAVFAMVGATPLWYTISNVCGMVTFAVVGSFFCLGVWQLVRGKSFARVDRDLYCLAGLYVLVAIFYVVFEKVVINYRPILVEGVIEASYPSTHTLLSVCVLGAALLQWHTRIARRAVRYTAYLVTALVMTATVAGRLLAGVHWLTDVFGGILLGAALLALYQAAVCAFSAPLAQVAQDTAPADPASGDKGVCAAPPATAAQDTTQSTARMEEQKGEE